MRLRLTFCDVGGRRFDESNPFHTRPEIMKNQSFLYQFGLKHRNEFFFLGTLD